METITGPVVNFIFIPVVQELGFLRIDSTDRPILKSALLSAITLVSRFDLHTARLNLRSLSNGSSLSHFSLKASKVNFEDVRSPIGRSTGLLPLNFIEPLLSRDFPTVDCWLHRASTSSITEGCGEILYLLFPR